MRVRICTLVLLALAGCDPYQAPASTPTAAANERTSSPDARVLAAAPAEVPALPEIPDEPPPDQPSTPELELDAELPAEPDVPVAPDDYGLIRPPLDPPEIDELTLHALAGYEVVAIYAEPDTDAERLGYLRIGARIRVTEKVEGKGCAKGWHALANGGFACASRGLVVGKTPPYMHMPPAPPTIDDTLPYRYAFVRKWNTPMFSRMPTADEIEAAARRRDELEAAREGPPAAKAPEAGDDATGAELPAPTTGAAEPAEAAAETGGAVEPEPPEVSIPLSPQAPWLEKGFFISLGEAISEGDTTWWRTARGGYVAHDAAYEYTTKDFAGNVLGPDTEFPFGYAMVKEAKVYQLDEAGKLSVVDKVPRRTFVDFEAETEIGGTTYLITTEGTLLRKKDVRLAQAQPLPKGLQPWERWIDVSLERQMLVAYEGERPVYVTLVSTGKKGTKAEPFDTPTGRWRIRSKHVSTTMDGGSATDGNYSIQDVPWTMYFHDSYALHGAFWHESFGRVRSHGCVNLGPSDARWLFMWTTPFLPEGWHGVHAHEGSPGTTVVVRD